MASRKKSAGPGKTPRRKSKKKGKTASGPKKPGANTGVPFEHRARDALAFLHPDLTAKHDVHLPMTYGGNERQFDVCLYRGNALEEAFEAKDWGDRVEFTPVEAFETRLRKLQTPPLRGGGVISAQGFQSGPVLFVGEGESMVRRLLQLRSVEDADWQDRMKSLRLQLMASSMEAADVHLTVAPEETPREGGDGLETDRSGCFLFDAQGQIKGNLLDQVNERLRSESLDSRRAEPGTVGEPIELSFDDDTYLLVHGRRLRAVGFSFRLSERKLKTTLSVDFSSGARDTLIDCLGSQRWIIPDPEKALSASRTGYDLRLTYENEAMADLSALGLPEDTGDSDPVAELANALQLQSLLRALARDDPSPRMPSEALEGKLKDATDHLLAARYAEAKALYWETCGEATSLIALVNLTYIYEREGDFNEAMHLAKRTIELFPLEVNGYANAAAIYLAQGKFDQACGVLRSARQLHAGHAELLWKEGELLRREERFKEAADVFARLCGIRRADAKARLNLAICESELGRDCEAAWDAMQAQRLGLDAPALRWHVIRLLNRANRYAEALELGRETLAMTVSPSMRDALRFETAKSACETGSLSEAVSLLSALDERPPQADYVLGIAEHRRGQHRAAYEAFCRYVQSCPDNQGLHNLAVAAADAGLYTEAHQALQSPVLEATDTVEYWRMRAIAAASVGDDIDAVKAAAAVARLGDDPVSLLLAASDSAMHVNQLRASIRLRSAIMNYRTEESFAIVQQVLIRSGMPESPGCSIEELEVELRRAEALGAERALVVYARMFLALHFGDERRIGALTEAVLDCHLTKPQALMLACEAQAQRRSLLTLRILDRYEPEPLESGLPDPKALRAIAQLRVGELVGDFKSLAADLEREPEHPLHLIVMACLSYGLADCVRCLELLDRAEMLTRSPAPIELPLRLQCLVELGHYGEAARLLREHFPQLPVTDSSDRWGACSIDAPELRKAIADPALRAALETAHAMSHCEHVAVHVRGGVISRALVSAEAWEPAFDMIARQLPPGIPLLIRTTDIPIRTIARLLGTAPEIS